LREKWLKAVPFGRIAVWSARLDVGGATCRVTRKHDERNASVLKIGSRAGYVEDSSSEMWIRIEPLFVPARRRKGTGSKEPAL
jgi:hypothetical protein